MPEDDDVDHSIDVTYLPKYDFGLAEPEKDKIAVGFVPDQLTPLDPDTAAKALSDGYKRVVGVAPSKKILALLIGQVAFETANFRSIHNYNYGNVRGTSRDGNWTSFPAGEIIDGIEVTFPASDGTTPEVTVDVGGNPRVFKNWFQAYPDATSGAEGYIRALRDRPNWWNGLQSGTFEGFMAGLTSHPAYFTASPAAYRNMQGRMDKYAMYAQKYGATGLAAVATAAVATAAGYFGVKKWQERKG